MGPGRDAQLERERRGEPLSPWGSVPWFVLGVGGIWAARRASAAKHVHRGRRLLLVSGIVIGGGVSELALRATVDK